LNGGNSKPIDGIRRTAWILVAVAVTFYLLFILLAVVRS